MKKLCTAVALTGLSAAASAQGSVHVICSVQAEWCSAIATAYARSTGIRIRMSLQGADEALAQLVAEKNNPQADVWFGGAGDPHLQAAGQGLTLEYRSPALAQLHPWAQQQARQSGYRTVGIYAAPLGFGYNPERLARKKLPVPRTWADLLQPGYQGEIQLANPASGSTGYRLIATLVQRMGEDPAFDYLEALHRNVGRYTRSGAGPMKAVARGEAALSIGFVHDATGERMQGFPIETVTPSDGTGAEIGSMSLVKGARDLEAARKFYEWALTPAAQQLGAAHQQFQLPSNVDARLDPRIPDFRKIKFIDHDHARDGASAERRRLIARWEKQVGALPR